MKEKQKLNYNVIASGSSGNAVRIGGIMVDCGVGFTEMKEDLYQVDTLLITHAHSDHVKPSTLESIRREFPRIKVYGNADVAYRYDVDKVIGTMPFDLPKGRHIIPFDGYHDIPVTGYIIQQDGLNILYMTDSNKVEPPVDIPLDYIFLESNYDERKLTEIGKRYAKGSYDPIANAHSLKLIEANMGDNIVESDVDFNIDRPLTDAERKETEFYCGNDVSATIKVYELRKKGYFETKEMLISMLPEDMREKAKKWNTTTIAATILTGGKPTIWWGPDMVRKLLGKYWRNVPGIPDEVWDAVQSRWHDSPS